MTWTPADGAELQAIRIALRDIADAMMTFAVEPEPAEPAQSHPSEYCVNGTKHQWLGAFGSSTLHCTKCPEIRHIESGDDSDGAA